MGLNNLYYSAIDYMLGSITLGYCLLFKNSYLRNYLDVYPILKNILKLSGSFNLLLNSENNNNPIYNNMVIQSAENCKGFSETVRQLSNSEEDFYKWLAGIIDGGGNFDIRKNVLKAIRIKLHNRDVRILTRIQNKLHMGRIRTDKNKPYSMFIVSTKVELLKLVDILNGLIRIKVPSFKKACALYNINFIEPDYNIKPNDPYFSGLIDTDGSIVFNFTGNRIECALELKYNDYTSKLNLESVIPNNKPSVFCRTQLTKKYNKYNKQYGSIVFKYQNVGGMLPLYDYFIKNRLYSDFKFYRVTQIKYFLEIRDYKHSDFDTVEYKIYSNFLLNWIQYKNPIWTKVPFVKKLNLQTSTVISQ